MFEKLKENKLDILGRLLYAALGALVLFLIHPGANYNTTITFKLTEIRTVKEVREIEKKQDKTEKKDQVIIRVIERPNEKITETITDKGITAEKFEEKIKETREERIERQTEQKQEIKVAQAPKRFAAGILVNPITGGDYTAILSITPFEKLPLSFTATNPINKIQPLIGIQVRW